MALADRSSLPFRALERVHAAPSTNRFSDSVFFESMRAHFVDGADWAETPFAGAVSNAPRRRAVLAEPRDEGRRPRALCRYRRALRRIATEGCRSQREPGSGPLLGVTGKELVEIGRDSELLFVNGRHRLAIAKRLDREAIPVGVPVRHRAWMTRRERCARNGTVGDRPNPRDLAETGP